MCRRQRWCLDRASFEAAITPRTKAVIVVDLYGNMPDMVAILDVARCHGVAVVEDAAEAIGSEFDRRKAGSFGDTGVFSFHGSKTLTTGEGGMLVTDQEDLFRRVLVLGDHGRPPGDRMFRNQEVAYKYKMSGLQAALGLAQLERIDELVARKREIFSWYEEHLGGLNDITLNSEAPTTKNTYWMVTVMLDPALGLKKEELMSALDARNVDARPFFHPLSALPAYQDFDQAREARQCNVVSYRLAPYGLNLPSGFHMTKEKVAYVCDALKDIVRVRRR